MKQTTDELKKIIANAPEIATHIDENGRYLALMQGWHVYIDSDGRDYLVSNLLLTRSLSDIKEIIELREKLEMAEQPVKFWVHTADDERT